MTNNQLDDEQRESLVDLTYKLIDLLWTSSKDSQDYMCKCFSFVHYFINGAYKCIEFRGKDEQ